MTPKETYFQNFSNLIGTYVTKYRFASLGNVSKVMVNRIRNTCLTVHILNTLPKPALTPENFSVNINIIIQTPSRHCIYFLCWN